MFKLYCRVGDNIEEGNFKKSLDHIFAFIKKANKYFDDEKPWINIKKDKQKCSESMYVCIQIIANLSNLLEPFIPFACEKVRGFLGIKSPVWMPIELKEGKIKSIEILFERLDKNIVEEELARLKDRKN